MTAELQTPFDGLVRMSSAPLTKLGDNRALIRAELQEEADPASEPGLNQGAGTTTE